RLLDRLLGLAGQAENEGAVDRDPGLVAILGEAWGDVDAYAFLDVVQDLLIAGLIADEQEPQAVVAHHAQRVARHVRLGIARPSDAEPAEPARDRLRSAQIVGERIVVEEELLDVGESPLRPGDLLDDVADAARAIAVAANGLRP